MKKYLLYNVLSLIFKIVSIIIAFCLILFGGFYLIFFISTGIAVDADGKQIQLYEIIFFMFYGILFSVPNRIILNTKKFSIFYIISFLLLFIYYAYLSIISICNGYFSTSLLVVLLIILSPIISLLSFKLYLEKSDNS
jgi:hypothetical protein